MVEARWQPKMLQPFENWTNTQMVEARWQPKMLKTI
jgi:hypothetical protein